jgi:hypothetical protein
MASQEYLLGFLLTILVLTAACGGGSSSRMAPPPVFTSTPGTAASQGVAYGYTVTATDPAGGTVTFALNSAPGGATFSANTLAWTPAATQARIADNFTITATTSEGASATQSWSVTPSGTISGSLVNTYWSASGPINVPHDWTKSLVIPQALVPQVDGSFAILKGSGNSDGTFTIENVPGGYYWLGLGSLVRANYWTSSSTFDFGADIAGRPIATTAAPETTTFAFNIDGLDPVQAQDQFAFLTDLAPSFLDIGFVVPSPAGSTTMTTSFQIKSNLDYSAASTGFLLQYEPASAGSVSGLALGPELTLSNLALTSGTTNSVIATLNPSPASSFDLSVKGSEWTPLFQNAGPGTVTPFSASVSVFAIPFAPGNKTDGRGGMNLPLFIPPLSANGGFLLGSPRVGPCRGTVAMTSFNLTSYPPMLTDQDFGTLPYGDPFDANWAHVFSLCQSASVPVPIPGSTATAPFVLVDGQNTSIPTAPVSPLAFPVVNPTINGSSFFTANTLNTTAVTLSWSAPARMAPFAYRVEDLILITLPDGTQGYLTAGVFYTGKTSASLPGLLPSQTYVFAVTTEVDGRANVETSPNRSALPTAAASVISAPITISAGAQAVRVTRR